MEDIDGNGVGGVDGLEDWILLGNGGRVVGTEDCRVVVLEDCRTGGKLKSCSIAGESHMQICLQTIRDSRRMNSSLNFQSSPSSVIHEIGPLFRTSELTEELRSDVCRTIRLYIQPQQQQRRTTIQRRQGKRL